MTIASQQSAGAPHALLLGRYSVVETRGSGGFGVVYVCWDTRLQRRVAIKCMPLAQAGAQGASTLDEALEEARITSRLSHPNIVTVHDFEVTGGYAYLIMEYVDGMTLAELMGRVEGGVLTYDECAHLLDSLAGALSYAHANGVLHLDIKPSNVFVDMTGAVKLGDFGMASLASAAGWEGARGGTIGYMPPEQLAGGLVDERTDVFALATMLYQSLTGISPFAAANAQTSLGRIERGAKPLARVEQGLAGSVSDQVARAMEADPSRRTATVDDFVEFVLPFLGDEQQGRQSIASLMAQARGETGPNEDAWEQAARVPLARRYPWLAGALARLVCALAGGGAVLHGSAALLAAASAPLPVAGAAVGAAAVCALLPRAGSALACAWLVAATFACGAYTPAFLAALVCATALAAWWARVGVRDPRSAAALLAGSALLSPVASAPLAARLSPGAAAATLAAGVGLAWLTRALAEAGAAGPQAAASALLSSLARDLAAPCAWVLVTGVALAGWAGASVGNGHSRGRRIAGQAACACVLAGALILAARVENAGIWVMPDMAQLAVALVCPVLMSIATGVLGPDYRLQRGE